MFGWLKRRQLSEHKKLLFQNIAAAQYFLNLFESNKQFDHANKMRTFLDANYGALETLFETPLSNDAVSRFLEINSELRRIDHFIFQSVTHFDKTYQPPEGWSRYFETLSSRSTMADSNRDKRQGPNANKNGEIQLLLDMISHMQTLLRCKKVRIVMKQSILRFVC